MAMPPQEKNRGLTPFQIFTAAQRPDLKQVGAVDEAWPPFMLHDPIGMRLFSKLYSYFPEFQLFLVDQNESVVGLGNSVPLRWDEAIANLPETGWDWVLQKGAQDRETGLTSNLLSAVQIVILPNFQGKGLSSTLVEGLRAVGRQHGMKTLVAPVRPNLKARYCLTPIERYIKWTDGKGLPFDPWMRVHARAGANIVKPAARSMLITGTVAEWEEWTGIRFPETGAYVVPGALVPVEIDLEKDLGRYVEPNVWMRHDL
ncbi:MAG: GNAT family N-acetyltransferase [Dehalococcoidia bacterium]